jgi:DNA-binding NtrC family response regulator
VTGGTATARGKGRGQSRKAAPDGNDEAPRPQTAAHEFRGALNALTLTLEALRTQLNGRGGADAELMRLVDVAARQCEQAMLFAEGLTGAPIPEASAQEAESIESIDQSQNARTDVDVTTSDRGRILIADDEPAVTGGLQAILSEMGYDAEVVSDGEAALSRLLAEPFGLVLADLKMPKRDGLALLKALQEHEVLTECIIITGQATVDSAVAAMQNGAYDYIEKPLNAAKLTRLKALIPKALEALAVKLQNRQLTSQLAGLTHYAELIGSSDPMREVYAVIDAVARSTASVLVLGESGTGKELVARALHQKSERAQGPFFALNCAALPKEILENELFGHERGAFTGSTNEKPGAFELANGGTLFLDEVAEMPVDTQPKLLRTLETRLVRRLGGKKEIPVDIRVVAASNRDLQQALADGELREDLYYRLAVVELYMPPLRERAGDIPVLANSFLARFAKQNGKTITGFDQEAVEWMMTYSWPGNVRDLKNSVERAVVMAKGPIITKEQVMPRHLRQTGPRRAAAGRDRPPQHQ